MCERLLYTHEWSNVQIGWVMFSASFDYCSPTCIVFCFSGTAHKLLAYYQATAAKALSLSVYSVCLALATLNEQRQVGP